MVPKGRSGERNEVEGAPAVDRERLREAAREVAEATGCRLVVLFGSATRPEQRRPEDLDLAVRADGPVDAVDLTNRFIRALGVQEVDIADLARADPLLMMRVVQEGEVLYEASPHEFAHFYSLANRRWADTRKFREWEKERLKAYIARVRGDG